MADEAQKKGSRPNSAASSKSSKSDKSDKSHKSDKSDKSHKSNKSDKSHKSHKSDKSTKKDEHKEQTTTAEAPTTAEAQPTQEAEAVAPPPPPEAAIYQPEEGAPAAEEVPVAAATEATENKEEETAAADQSRVVEAEPVEAQPVTSDPQPAPQQDLQLGQRTKSVLDDLTPEERERFEALFEMYATEDGTNGGKKLTTSGIKMLFRFMGEIVNEAILAQWLKEEDRDVDGMFDFEEFCGLYKRKRQPEDQRREDLLMCVNKLFPTNGCADDDYISLDKVSSLMKHVNTRPELMSEKTTLLSDADIDNIIAKADVDNNKKMSRQEFVNFLCSLE